MLEGGFNMTNDENKMSHEEVGHKVGEKTAQEYSSEHFQEIDRKGGETTSKENNDN
ncbi:glucose starvation-inducible protein B domain protein [Staphylococcus simulans]|nr:glucose starvation-inducible protein B domain protein [Staphylococcus simulans]